MGDRFLAARGFSHVTFGPKSIRENIQKIGDLIWIK